jgi:hypothetical protein
VLVHAGRGDPNAQPWASMSEIDQAVRRHGTAEIEPFRLYRVIKAANAEPAVVLPQIGDHAQ